MAALAVLFCFDCLTPSGPRKAAGEDGYHRGVWGGREKEGGVKRCVCGGWGGGGEKERGGGEEGARSEIRGTEGGGEGGRGR